MKINWKKFKLNKKGKIEGLENGILCIVKLKNKSKPNESEKLMIGRLQETFAREDYQDDQGQRMVSFKSAGIIWHLEILYKDFTQPNTYYDEWQLLDHKAEPYYVTHYCSLGLERKFKEVLETKKKKGGKK